MGLNLYLSSYCEINCASDLELLDGAEQIFDFANGRLSNAGD